MAQPVRIKRSTGRSRLSTLIVKYYCTAKNALPPVLRHVLRSLSVVGSLGEGWKLQRRETTQLCIIRKDHWYMRLITLNTWAGKVYEPLLAFVQKHASQTDIFCFQEMFFGNRPEFTSLHKARINLYTEIMALLPEFVGYRYLAPEKARYFIDDPLTDDTHTGQAIFVKNTLTVNSHGGFRSYDEQNPIYNKKMTGSCQWVEIQKMEEILTVLNFHGLWQEGTGKVDTPERLAQSHILNQFLKTCHGHKILCGDFNLLPDGESIHLLEHQQKNLIREFGITSTRSSLYQKSTLFADYVLISPDIIVDHFSVLPDVVSDHLPLALEFTFPK